jgi:hypothetical protein
VSHSFNFSFSAPFASAVSCRSYRQAASEDSKRISDSGPVTRGGYRRKARGERHNRAPVTQFVDLLPPEAVEA